MKTESFIADDPVVQEVRAARVGLWRTGGGTVSGFMQIVKEVARGKRRTRYPVNAPKGRKQGRAVKKRPKVKRSRTTSS